MKKYSRFGWFKKILQDFDMFKSPANLRMKQEPDASQYCSGVFSMLLFGFFIFVLVNQFKKVLNFESIKSVPSTENIYNLSQPSTSNILFAFSPAWENYVNYSQYFTVQSFLVYSNQNVQPAIYQTKYLELQRCRKQQWQNFTNIYTEYEFSQNMCVKYPQKININGTNFLGQYSYFNIILKRCNEDQKLPNTTCLGDQNFTEFMKYIQQKQHNYYSFYIVDTSISADKQNPINPYVRLNFDIDFSRKMRKQIDLRLGLYSVETDTSLLPFEKTEMIEGYYVNQKTIQTVDLLTQTDVDRNIYGHATVYMMNKKKVFKRKIGKLDEVISYAGGLFGLLIAFFAFIINSYNQYSYELMMAQYAFNYDQHGNQIKQKDFNFLRYIEFSIYDWVKFMFCYQINWTYDKQKDQTREESNSTMDVMNLYRKIQLAQVQLEYIYDKNELILLNLVKQPTIQQVHLKRKRMEYYKEVTKGEVAINVQDIIHTKQSLQQHKKAQQIKNSQTSLQNFQQIFNRSNNKVKVKNQVSLDSLLTDEQKNKSRDYIKRTSSIDQFEGNQQPLNRQGNNSKKNINSSIESSLSIVGNQSIRKKFLKYSGIEDSAIINKIAEFTDIEKEAKQMTLSEEMLKVEEQFAMAYQKLNPKIKHSIGSKIPLKILHRLFDCLQRRYNSVDSSVPLIIQKI